MLELNTIHLGDSYKLIKNIPDKSIDLIYTDIPYLYDIGGAGGNSRVAKNKARNKKEIKHLSNGIDYKIFKEFLRVLKTINVCIWCSRNQLIDILNYFYESGGGTPSIHIWGKTNPFPSNSTWLSDIEYCVNFTQDHTVVNDEPIDFDKKFKYYISPANVEDKKLYKHPTIKPLNFVSNQIEVLTKKGDTVLDPFSGSGTTCVACKELERNFIGIEVNPEYHKISIDRLNGITANGQMSIFTDVDKLEQLTIGVD